MTGETQPFRPRAGRGRRTPGVAFATTAAVGLVLGVLLVVFILRLAQSGTVKNQLGDRVFDAGRAADLYREVVTPAANGRTGPILLQALVGNRDIYLQHQGTDPNTGWLAFDAHAPGADRTCTLVWVPDPAGFRDPCDGRTFPPDGSGLQQYNTTVNASHRVIVDLRSPLPLR